MNRPIGSSTHCGEAAGRSHALAAWRTAGVPTLDRVISPLRHGQLSWQARTVDRRPYARKPALSMNPYLDP